MGDALPRPPRAPLWRQALWGLIVAVALANLLVMVGRMDGASDDLLPPWVLARLAVTGHGADTYDFPTQAVFLRSLHRPPHQEDILDAPNINDIGICPYPPTLPVLYAPLSLLPFDTAAIVFYLGSIALTPVCAWAISRSVGGRVGVLAALAAILCYPGLYYTLYVGQNSV